MKHVSFDMMRAAGIGLMFLVGSSAVADPKHGIAMYGEPALPPDFVSLPYVNPDAPTGGKMVVGEVGSFDSLNPHIRKGRVPWQLRFLAYESLMGRSWDEPFSLYGLLAESIDTDSSGKWVEFILRPEAKFSDGSPVTIDDVIWSYETLGTKGHPRYLGAWTKIEKMEQTGPSSVRFTFNEPNRELALIMGMRPILKKAQWDGKTFDDSGLDVVPIGSAPYVIDDFQAGRFVSLKRNPDYWGNELPFRRGTNRIDEVRMEFFGDATAHFEAFKAGEISALRESNAAKWDQQYSFPRVTTGQIVKSEIPHKRPSGMTGFVMNTREDKFKDWRVREAIIQAFNFEFTNDKLNGGKKPRITSYFSNSVLSMEEGPATGKVALMLQPYKDHLLPGALEGYELPVSDGRESNRKAIRSASKLLEDAGWTVQDGKLSDADGKPFELEILLTNGSSENRAIMNVYTKGLQRIGIFAEVTTTDSAQFKERTDRYDFDMTYYTRGLSLSPGNEQLTYWGSEGADIVGGRNLMGVKSPAIDGLVQTMLTSESQDDYVAAVQALDRVLISGRYVVPIWHSDVSMLAHDSRFKFPDKLPIYGDYIGFMPDVWWFEKN